MTILQIIGISGGILASLSLIIYIYEIIWGNTRPERATWFIWMILTIIAFFSQKNEGATDSLWLTATTGIGMIFIFLLSIKKGIGGFIKRDYIALGFTAVGLILWYLTREAVYALIIVIIIDGIGAYLTILKIIKEPHSESLNAWILSVIGALLGTIAVGKLDVILLLYPTYLFIANAIIVTFILKYRTKNKNLLFKIND
jgi:hypothetical protein